MNVVAALIVFAVAVQAQSVSKLAGLQSIHKYVTPNPRHTAEEWDAIYAAAEANIPEDTTGLVPGTAPPPRDAGKVFVEPAERIIAGTAASRGQIPWQALLIPDEIGFGGGSLITSEWVLTAAHCLDGFKSFRIILGSTSRNTTQSGSISQNARQVIIHANYDSTTVANDIGLLKLTSAVSFTNYINVVRLPRSGEENTTFAGLPAMISGFGRISSDNNEVSNDLLYVNVTVISNAECARTFGSFLQATNICSLGANGRAPCIGDSGGALVVRESDGRYTEVGILSLAVMDCPANRPSGYTRVSKYLAWISSHTGVAIIP